MTLEVCIGGEGGIRTQPALVDSASCRFHVANIAVNASVAVAPCPQLPAGNHPNREEHCEAWLQDSCRKRLAAHQVAATPGVVRLPPGGHGSLLSPRLPFFST